MPKLSIVMPVFNEEENIPKVIDKYLKIKKSMDIEVIFVEDGGSKDKTREVLKKYSKKYKFIKPIFINEKGYGISLYKGFKSAKSEFICWTHADLQTDPADTIKALELIRKQKNPKNSYIKGKRYGRAFFDTFFTFGMSIFETIILKKFMYDINAQPNLIHKSFLKLMKRPPKDFSFDLYTYYLAKKENYNLIRFPVYFGRRIHGQSAWNVDFNSKLKFIKRTIDFTFKLKRLLKG